MTSIEFKNHFRKSYASLFVGSDVEAWPPRSPDLTPLDFFLREYIKDIVYNTPVVDLADLVEGSSVFVKPSQGRCFKTPGEKSNIV